MSYSGSCLCGETKVEIVNESFDNQVLCHCTDCRRTSGSAFSTNVLASVENVTISGPFVKEFAIKAASGNTVTRVFCSNCGSAISHKAPVAFKGKQAIQTGNIDAFAKIPIAVELFVKDRWTGLAPVEGAAQVPAMPS